MVYAYDRKCTSRIEGEITFLAQVLLHQHSSLLSKKSHCNLLPRGGFSTVHKLCNIGEDPMNARSHLESTARLCQSDSSLPTQYTVTHFKPSHCQSCLTTA
ncbi:hypothetical protein BsWGS_11911 [Bradybaena similaris]